LQRRRPGIRFSVWDAAAIVVLLLPWVTARPARAQPSPSLLCTRAIEATTQLPGLPPRLLSSVAQVESGKRDPVTGAWQPWPWTINIEGEGRYFETEAEAIEAVRAVQARGIRSIDVGCMQVNLMYHPAAFESLEQAFDPRANVLYARRFLLSLYRLSGDWPTAVGLYHSATPALAAGYRQRVLGARAQPIPSAIDRQRTALALAWGATLAHDKRPDGSPPSFAASFGPIAAFASTGRLAPSERIGTRPGRRTR
jgi:hypothetical protein